MSLIELMWLFPFFTGYVAGFFEVYFKIPRIKALGTLGFTALFAYLGYQIVAHNPVGYILLALASIVAAGWLTAGRGQSLRGPSQPLVVDNDYNQKIALWFFRKRTAGDQLPMNGVWWVYMFLRHIIPSAAIAACFVNPYFLLIGPTAWISYSILGPFIAKGSKGALDTDEGNGQEFVAGLFSGFAFVLPFFLVLSMV